MTAQVFEVAPGGGGVGVGVFRTETGPVTVHVLPKFWRKDGSSARQVNLCGITPPRAIVVYEQDRILVDAELGQAISGTECVQMGKTDDEEEQQAAQSDEDDPDERPDAPASRREKSRLFERRVGGSSDKWRETADQAEAAEDDVRSLWRLIAANMGLESVDTPDDLEWLAQIHDDVPSLEYLIHRMFVDALAEAMRTRRHVFASFTDETIFVRGRMEVDSLIDRRARKRLPVRCTFDDLSHDTLFWQILRAATRVIAGGADTESATRAVEHDFVLSGVSIVPTLVAVRAVAGVRRSLRTQQHRQLLTLAQSVLMRRFPGGGLDGAQDAASVSIKIAPARLWEILLERALVTPDDWHSARRSRRRLFGGVGIGLAPDIMCEVEGAGGARRLVVVDAKYKYHRGGASVSKLERNDQYQCFAYATIFDAPTAFVTVGDAAAYDEIQSARTTGSDAPVTAVPVPFPEPGATALAEQDVAALRTWLETAAATMAGRRPEPAATEAAATHRPVA